MATGRNPKPVPPSSNPNRFVQFFGQVKGAFSDKPKIIVDKKTMEKAWKLMDKVKTARQWSQQNLFGLTDHEWSASKHMFCVFTFDIFISAVFKARDLFGKVCVTLFWTVERSIWFSLDPESRKTGQTCEKSWFLFVFREKKEK